MARSLISTAPGTSPNYIKYLYGDVVKTDRINEAKFLDLSLATVEDPAFVKLVRGNYVIFNTDTFGKWFTGYVQDTPEPQYIGVNAQRQGTWIYHYKLASDDIILSFQPLGIIPPYINTTQGAILLDLANRLYPGKFNTSNVADGATVAEYQIDPQKKFTDIVKEFCASSNFRFWASDLKLNFQQQDAVPAALTVDGNNKYFTPSSLKVQPSTEQLVNDAVVLGDVEPQAYVTEYFVSDGFEANYPTIKEVYGVTPDLLLDETFSASPIDLNTWAVVDPLGTFLQTSNGFLNALGGNNTGAFDIYLRTLNTIAIQGNLRLTHGEFDFVAASSGMLASLWSTPAIDSSLAGCIYGLQVSKSGASTVLNPVVNGVVDSSQNVTIADYTSRYVMRSLVTCQRVNRSVSEYSYIDANGVVQGTGGNTYSDVATITTLIVVIDPTTGETTKEFSFTSTVDLGSTTLSAFYAPVISVDMHVTLTSITLSTPLQASLSLQDLTKGEWLLYGAGPGDIGIISDTAQYAYQAMPNLASLFSAFVHPPVGNAGCKSGIMMRADLGPSSAMISATLNPAGDLVVQTRDLSSNFNTYTNLGNFPDGTYIIIAGDNVNSVARLDLRRVILTQLSKASVLTSSDGVNWTLAKELPFIGSMFYAGLVASAFLTTSTMYGRFDHINWADWTNQNLTSTVLGSPVVAGSTVRGGAGTWTPQIVGFNEIDAQDGLEPVATVVNSAPAQAPQAAFGSTYYQPSVSTLTFFKDTSQQFTSVPPAKTLMKLKYRSAGFSVGRVNNSASITAESAAWGDSGLRSVVRTDVTPLPKTSEECEQAAAAIVGGFGYQHYDGTYQHESIFEFTGEPQTGTILTFRNMNSAAYPAIFQETIIEVVTKFVSASPREIFDHAITFGKPDLLKQFLSQVTDPKYSTVIPPSTATLPSYVDISELQAGNVPSTDSFNRANQTLFALSSWIALSGSPAGFNLLSIVNNSLGRKTTDIGGVALFTTIPNGSDGYAQCTILALPDDALQVAMRCTGTPNTISGYFGGINVEDPLNQDNKVYRIERYSNGVGTNLAVSAQTAAPGDVVRLDVLGGDITLTVNSTVILSVTDPSPLPAGMTGIYLDDTTGNNSTGFIDDFSASSSSASSAPDVLSVELTSWDANGFNWTLGVNPPSGGGFEVRSTDRGWGQLNGKNLISRLTGTQQTFSSSRSARGKTVFVKAYDANNRYSRFAAVGRVNLPLIPQPPTASVDPANPVAPVISVNLPALLDDVWGIEVRGSDNATVIYSQGLGDAAALTTFTDHLTVSFTDDTNLSLQMQYYVYTFNILGEYSASFFVNGVSAYFITGVPLGKQMLLNASFESTAFAEQTNVGRPDYMLLEEGWYVSPERLLPGPRQPPFGGPPRRVII